MNRSLNEHELAYVFQHLELVMDTSILKDHFIYGESSDHTNKIIFIPNTEKLDVSTINELPVLFGSTESDIFSLDEHGNLIFHHDLLKSSFYLLSCYDECYVNTKRDPWGRVMFDGSIQKQIGIIDRPIVNEYFEFIFNGINAFLSHHNKPKITKRKLFETFGLLLSHDIDVIDKYGWPHLGYKIKELLGLVKSEHSFLSLLKSTITSAFHFINPWRPNPYWNFEYLHNIESRHNIKASYYFLDKDNTGGSRYSFDEKRLVSLFKKLKNHKHEIGIHGTTKTANDSDMLVDEISRLMDSSKVDISGGRQHRLWLDPLKTFKIHEQSGLKYDSSFGFAEREGFRNSFCLPFKPYDFENQRAIDVWQFPLMVMDVTLFSYRKLDAPNEALTSIEKLLHEVEKHNGIITLLWHNSFFDETLYPKVTTTYEQILKLIEDHKAEGITGKEVLSKLANMTS
ncbi:hypothetical protein SAMN05421640_3538 [Ekhidna lutea]|uniref:DUF7033 domain-containing protein n=1 Tax=Ekhidna lutea TaxID=447679 RepID=A0A239M1S9_EKHLU|nr:polysaccharide deacetylase family protein [Ekhidna lutea]SNT36043.1 hypothetical protein SAMN05421640_3538 [Ekhidna lutea]